MSEITNKDVIDFLKARTREECFLILKAAYPYDFDVNDDGEYIWLSGVSPEMMRDDEEVEENQNEDEEKETSEYPDWLNQSKSNHVKFYNDMVKAGFEEQLRHYHGRFFYDGPAVTVSSDEMQDVYAATKVRLTKDNMAFDWVLYPQ